MQKGDEVVTQDYGLEAMCLARGARALNREGMEYTGDNIDALLLARHTAKKIRNDGGRHKRPFSQRVKVQTLTRIFCYFPLGNKNVDRKY
ncbi:hypothetical protein SDC9_195750 [bioreactor metagenome]|uniref:Uncharacterized protein n=1 Tax=bioreactor metagenome TaxID=1076179 RepID=A0A645I9X1_9ZZZZ